jgi:cytochrome c oxidase assembly protein subunit 15
VAVADRDGKDLRFDELLVQVTLGIADVPASLPLLVGVAHNGVAALLLAMLVMLNFVVYAPSSCR